MFVCILFQGGSILLITGPPGCGKTTTIKILSKEHGIQVQEWINPVLPDFQKHDFKEIINPGKVCCEGSRNSGKSLCIKELETNSPPIYLRYLEPFRYVFKQKVYIAIPILGWHLPAASKARVAIRSNLNE